MDTFKGIALMKELKETLKELLSIFKHIPLFLLLAFLTVFHITLLSGEYSKAMENLVFSIKLKIIISLS